MTASAEIAKALQEIARELKLIRKALYAAPTDRTMRECFREYMNEIRPISDGEGSENE